MTRRRMRLPTIFHGWAEPTHCWIRTLHPPETSRTRGAGADGAGSVDAGGMADEGLVEADHLGVVCNRNTLIGAMETRQILRPRAYRRESVHIFGDPFHVA